MAQESIWNGSSTFTTGSTPWGLYDTDSSFSTDADKFADWSARRLGYPIMSVELQSGSFYACFEEAISEYSAQVNQFNIKDNLLHLTGQVTGSNVTHKRITPTMGRTVFLSKQYGTEAGVGGDVDIKKGSISISGSQQEYDLNKLVVDASTSGSIEIKRVYFEIKATDRNARGSVWVSDTDHAAVIGTNYAGVSMHSGGAVTSGTSNSNLDQAPTDGDIVCYAVDLDNGQVWLSRNADIDTSGTANITGLATSGLDRDYRISQRETGNPASTFEHNYGNAPYAISSSNADADGHGSFEYAVPSGYFALCTKNLAEYG